MRYIPLIRSPRADWDDLDAPHRTMVVVEEEAKPQPTGLYDRHGVPLYRMPDRIKPGFVK